MITNKKRYTTEYSMLWLTKLLSSRGTPGTLVDKRSFVFDGDKENLIISPKLITLRKKMAHDQLFAE